MTLTMSAQAPLPPGDPLQLLELEQADRRYLLKAADVYGPIFKALSDSHLCVCIVGLPLARRFLREHGDAVRPVTLDLAALFPQGFMRQMRGSVHRSYRGALVNAIGKGELADPDALAALVRDALAAYAAVQASHRRPARAYVAALSELATSILLSVFFGASPGSGLHRQLCEGFSALGPFGLAWSVGRRQHDAFAQLRTTLLDKHSDQRDCIMRRLEADGQLDEVLLGNLIYMVEMGRFDIAGYLRWLSWHAAQNPAVIDEIAAEQGPLPERCRARSEAFALETLRMDQSERLLRKVERDICFEGFHIPETATVRLCLWESHKSASEFDAPFRFDHTRFLDDPPSPDQFSPFGLDQHHCPFAAFAVAVGASFVRALACGYRLGVIADGPAVRGPYHWEPAPRFGVELTPRVQA